MLRLNIFLDCNWLGMWTYLISKMDVLFVYNVGMHVWIELVVFLVLRIYRTCNLLLNVQTSSFLINMTIYNTINQLNIIT